MKDNEGAAYALDTCTKAIQKAENQFNNIKEFSNTVLIIPLDFLGYEKALAEIKRFFSVYSQEVRYAMPPYFLREHHEFNDAQAEDFDDILKSFENEEEMEAYLKENPSIQQNPSYYIDPPGNPYEVRTVYKNNREVSTAVVCNEWIAKMNDFAKSTSDFNNVHREKR